MKSISERNDQKLMSMSQDLHDARKELRAITKQLNQYKSIVKKVDADNLPDFDVLILDQKNELYSTGLFIENQRVVGFLNSEHEINHYIEIKDIIKLLEDSK